MVRCDKTEVYVPDALVKLAREKGLQNLSEFVRDALTEYIKQREHEERRKTTVATSRE
jgi:metal-responsive CopG/Arc/MetJ family transcriptional regulator